MAELFKILQPLQFMQTFLNSGSRPDGRKFDESRGVLMSCDCVSTANGSALIKFGNSSVICGIKTCLVKPNGDKPEEGILEIDVRFSNTCSNELENPDRTTISGYVRECIKKVLQHGQVLDMEQLCLIPRKYAWKIALEIICLNMDGSIVDLSLLAALAALKKCHLRKYDVDTEVDIITPSQQFEALRLRAFPILITFVMIGDNLLMDPTMNEEELSDSLIRIAVDPDQSTDDHDTDTDTDTDCIFLLEITGCCEVDSQLLKNVYQKALKRARFLKQISNKHIECSGPENCGRIKYEAMQI